MRSQNWSSFRDAWNAIPRDQRPADMTPIPKESYDAMKKTEKPVKTSAIPAPPEAMVAALLRFNETEAGGSVPFKPAISGPRGLT